MKTKKEREKPGEHRGTVYFEDFSRGDKFQSRKPRVITQEDIKKFAELTGDLNPLHLSEEYARKTIFGRTIAHGVLTLGIALGEWYSLSLTRDSIIAFMGVNNLSFREAVFPGDSLTLRSEVKSSRESKSRKDAGILTFRDRLENQDGATVLEFERTLLLRKRKAQNDFA